jgi:hypothetical protein
MPTIPWLIGLVVPNRMRYQLVLTVAGLASAVLAGGLLFEAHALRQTWRKRDTLTCFFVATACAFTVLHLLYVQFNDTYLIVFLPFVLFAFARLIRIRGATARCIQMIAVCSAIFGIAIAFWMRGDYNRQEAIWRASEQIHAEGVDTMQIRGSLQWAEYHSAFDKWLAQLGPQARPEDYSGPYRLHNPFYAWVVDMQKQAEYIIYSSDLLPQVEGYEIVGHLPYRDGLFRQHFVYIIKRKAG